jgi:hypothetical protein
MLTEFKGVRQREEEGTRRWFFDDYFDLIVWYDNRRQIEGFQLCYEKNYSERALTWMRKNGFSHDAIDSGEEVPGHKQTAILVADGVFDKESIARRFKAASKNIDRDIADFVYNKVLEYTG